VFAGVVRQECVTERVARVWFVKENLTRADVHLQGKGTGHSDSPCSSCQSHYRACTATAN
jgi:hypothetical protein